ncbi:hypothetical protein Fcan01_28615 [Folsomia candida]|uniref:Uncharacterized protein n=1 Tax=Folsomia candida TaxID=158441 RepID=A0A226CV47_FOLCA|nr:hypothetical protein Fcan01_28615 [Folsomia candida]
MPPVKARDSGKGRFYALGHSYKSETDHFYDNFKGIRENSEIPKLHEKGNLNLEDRENCEIPKLPEKGVKINLKIPAKCHTLQLETSGLRHLDAPREGLNLVCPAKCHPLKLETPERARSTPLGHSYKSETDHFYDNFKGIRENSEIPKLHEKGKPKSCMSCQMPPVTARDSAKGALYAPRCGLESAIATKVKRPLYDNFKGIRENSEIPKLHERENLNLYVLPNAPVTVETPERARCTPLGVDLKVYNQL